MKNSKYDRINPRLSAFKIALIYVIVSIIWIITSDQIISMTIVNQELLTMAATIKGTFFVILTTILIYVLIQQNLASIKESEERFFKAFNSNPIAIVLTQPSGEILDVNQSYLQLTGFNKKELMEKTALDLNITTANIRSAVMREFKDKGSINDFKTDINTKFNERRTVLTTIEPITIAGKKRHLNYLYDITPLEESQKKLKSSLNEKEALLREVNHRVNNNLQIITSLLNLQSKNVENDFKDILMVSQSRVKSMAMIYEKLHKEADLTHIHFGDYIKNFASDLFYLYRIDRNRITVITDLENIEIGIDTAIPLGLIINEIIVNILKHAFPEDQKGTITISLNSKGDKFTLEIADDGIGIPENIRLKDCETLGLQLVNNLVEQLDGTLEISVNKGTTFKIIFKELHYIKRI